MARSRVLDRNGRRETGLYIFTSEELSVGFLSSGVTLASLRASGKQPVDKEMLMRWVRKGRRSGAIDWRR